MGQSVSNLQYIQLTELQEAAIRADVYMKSLADKYDENTLRQNPQWRELVSLANSLSDLIPQEVKKYYGLKVWENSVGEKRFLFFAVRIVRWLFGIRLT